MELLIPIIVLVIATIGILSAGVAYKAKKSGKPFKEWSDKERLALVFVGLGAIATFYLYLN